MHLAFNSGPTDRYYGLSPASLVHSFCSWSARAKGLPTFAADYRSRSLFNRPLNVTKAHDQAAIGRREHGHLLPRAFQQNLVLHKFNRQFRVEKRCRYLFIRGAASDRRLGSDRRDSGTSFSMSEYGLISPIASAVQARVISSQLYNGQQTSKLVTCWMTTFVTHSCEVRGSVVTAAP